MHNLLAEYDLANRAEIVIGGGNRLLSTINGVKYIEEKYSIQDNDVFLAHDSVRIFTSHRILKENIQKAHEHGAATTIYYLEETIHKANKDGLLFKAYPRENRYTGQSPQTFNIKKFLACFNKLTNEQKETFTDLAEVLYANDEKVAPVLGEKDNIKITTPFDLTLASLRLD